MLLARIQDLMDADVRDWREFPVYEALVESWLLREERDKPGQASRKELWDACTTVALHLQSVGKREPRQAKEAFSAVGSPRRSLRIRTSFL